MTVGESSGCQEASDDSFRDQPRASACDQVNENSTEEETAHEEGKKMSNHVPVCTFLLYFLPCFQSV